MRLALENEVMGSMCGLLPQCLAYLPDRLSEYGHKKEKINLVSKVTEFGGLLH